MNAGQSHGCAGVPRHQRPARRSNDRPSEVYEVNHLDFADAYLVACAERTGVGALASFDRSIDRIETIRREEPACEQ